MFLPLYGANIHRVYLAGVCSFFFFFFSLTFPHLEIVCVLHFHQSEAAVKCYCVGTTSEAKHMMPSVVEQVCSKKHRLSVTVDCCDLYPPRQVLLRFIICGAKGTNEKTYVL